LALRVFHKQGFPECHFHTNIFEISDFLGLGFWENVCGKNKELKIQSRPIEAIRKRRFPENGKTSFCK